jgi:hypothetical protein
MRLSTESHYAIFAEVSVEVLSHGLRRQRHWPNFNAEAQRDEGFGMGLMRQRGRMCGGICDQKRQRATAVQNASAVGTRFGAARAKGPECLFLKPRKIFN